jgi:hypothetical protein
LTKGGYGCSVRLGDTGRQSMTATSHPGGTQQRDLRNRSNPTANEITPRNNAERRETRGIF